MVAQRAGNHVDAFKIRLARSDIMPLAAAVLASAVIGGGAAIYGANKSSSAIRNATQGGVGYQLAGLQKAEESLGPYVGAGESVLPILKSLLTPGPNQTSTLNQTPGFQFAQDWGMKSIANLGTSRGLGGNVLKAGADYSTGLAANSTFFPLIQALQGYANMGSGAAGQLAGAATGTGNNIANTLLGGTTSAATAQAGGIMGAGSSISNALSQITNLSLLDQLTGGKIGMYGGSGNQAPAQTSGGS